MRNNARWCKGNIQGSYPCASGSSPDCATSKCKVLAISVEPSRWIDRSTKTVKKNKNTYTDDVDYKQLKACYRLVA